jgi:hypothetical protein
MKFAWLQNGKLSYSVLNVNICQQSLYTVNFQEVSLSEISFSPLSFLELHVDTLLTEK